MTRNSTVTTLRAGRKSVLCTTTAILALSAAAVHAQTPPKAPAGAAVTAAAQSDPVAEVVVTAAPANVQTSIDRKSYSVTRDLQASTGSAADVLRNVPSITVDLDGNPSLRGDGSVQILIDGRPSPQFNSTNRGTSLQQLNADGIERIEVLTNPPANFKVDGSAGVINIITKRRTAKTTATATASAGSGGRYNIGGTLGGQVGKLNLHGSASVRRDIRDRTSVDNRTVREATGGTALSTTAQRVAASSDRLSSSVGVGGDIDLTAVDRISAEGNYVRRVEDSTYRENNRLSDPAGSTTRLYDRARPGHEAQVGQSAMLRYHHAVDDTGSGLTATVQDSQTAERQRLNSANTYTIPALSQAFQNQTLNFTQRTREFSLDYATALFGAKLITGYDLQKDTNQFDNGQTLSVSTGVGATDPNFTNKFRFDQTVHALYGSYERPLAAWTLLAGLRLEQTEIRTNQITTGQRDSQSYFRAYPNLHLTKRLSDTQTLSFSYGRRVIRPEADDLNPFPVQQDAFTLRRGNPQLQPQEIDSFEVGWAYDKGSVSRSATVYVRPIRNGFTVVNTTLSPTTILVTEANLGKSLSSGLELAAAGKILPRLDYNISGNVFYNQIDAANLGISRSRSGFGYQAKATLNWRVTDKDTAQISLNSTGDRLTPQGHRIGSTAVDLGYRHQLQPNLAFTATVSDVFDSRRDGAVVSTSTLSDVITRRQGGRIAMVGLTWSLGDIRKKSAGFEYDR